MRLKEVETELARLRQEFDAFRQLTQPSIAESPPAYDPPISERPLDALDPDTRLTCREVADRLGIRIEALQGRRARGRDGLVWDRSGPLPTVRAGDLLEYIARLDQKATVRANLVPRFPRKRIPRFRGQPPKPAIALADLNDDIRLDTVQVAGYLGLSIGSVDMARRYPERWLHLRWQRDGRYSKPWVSAGDLKAAVAARTATPASRRRGPKPRPPTPARTASVPACGASANQPSQAQAQAQEASVKPAVGLCFSPIVLKGKVISRLSELAEVLSQRWPANQKTESYKTALRTAHAAYLGQTSPDEARLAFLVAAQEAGLAVKPTRL